MPNNTNILSRTNTLIFAIILVFTSTILLGTISASAAPTKSKYSKAIDNNLAGCIIGVSGLKQTDLAGLKKWGKTRFDKRLAVLNKYNDKIDKKYAKLNDSKGDKKKKTVAIAKKNGLKDPEIKNSNYITIDVQLVKEVNTAITDINALNVTFQAASTPAGAAKPLCSLVYTQKIYAYFNNKIIQSVRVDTLWISLQTSGDRIVNRKTSESNYVASTGCIGEVCTPVQGKLLTLGEKRLKLEEKRSSIEDKLDGLTRDSLNSADEKGHATSADIFNSIWGKDGRKDYDKFKAETKQLAKDVAQVPKAKKAKKAKKSKKNDSKSEYVPPCYGEDC